MDIDAANDPTRIQPSWDTAAVNEDYNWPTWANEDYWTEVVGAVGGGKKGGGKGDWGKGGGKSN